MNHKSGLKLLYILGVYTTMSILTKEKKAWIQSHIKREVERELERMVKSIHEEENERRKLGIVSTIYKRYSNSSNEWERYIGTKHGKGNRLAQYKFEKAKYAESEASYQYIKYRCIIY
jgi:hypothetical protein